MVIAFCYMLNTIEGIIPRGEKVMGFKELFWEERTLDEVIKSRRNGNKENN